MERLRFAQGLGDRRLAESPPPTRSVTLPPSRRPIRIPKTAEVVAADVRGMIIRGELREGDFLRSEGGLMELYGTSRPTIREALRILENEQFISIVRGARDGASVRTPTVAGVARYAGFALQVQGTLLADIYQARLAVEPFAARIAASADPPPDLTRLRGEIAAVARLAEDPARQLEFRIAVARLHLPIVELAGSPMLTLIAAMLARVIESHQSRFTPSRSPLLQTLTAQQHLKRNRAAMKSFGLVADLIEARDPDGAEGQLRRHIENASATWLSGYDQATVIDVLD
jgi:DNA-binding FadR family transcriptional regulator